MTRTFARLWAASLFSEIAEWMMLVALPVFIYQSTGSAGSTALAMAAGVAPMVVLSPVAGYVADRWDQGRTLSLVCAAQAVCVVPLLLHDDVWLVYTVMVAQSAAATLFEPARNALIPRIVSPGRIVAANGWMGFNSSGARLLGSSMGGILLAVGGMPTLIASYLGVLVIATALLARRFDAAGTPVAREPMWRMWLDGLAEFRRERRLRLVGSLLLIGATAQGMFLVLFVVFVTGPLGGGEAQVGLLRGAQAVGGLVAGVVVGTSLLRRPAPETMAAAGATCAGVLTLAIWNTPALTTDWTVYFVLFAIVGAPGVLVLSGSLTVLQTACGAGKSGRVLASIMAVMALCQMAGMLVAGQLVSVWGLNALLNIQAVVMVVSGLPVLPALLSTRRAARRPQETVSATTAARSCLDR